MKEVSIEEKTRNIVKGEETIPLEEIILNVWELGNYWKELTKGVCNTEYGTQLAYIVKHWKEGEHYIKFFEKQGEQKKSYDTCDSSTKDNKKSPYGEKRDFGYFEEKPTDKTEPKFHEGDWVVDKYGIVQQILSYKDYIYKHTNGYSSKLFEDKWRMWDITKDAKDGDVLTCYSDIKGQPIEQTGIIKQYVGRHGGCSNSFKAHFGVDWDNNVVIEGYMGSSNIYPATKEQHDNLMKAMADAGYTFDFEKKELKKIEQNPAWSEEDEEQARQIERIVHNEGYSQKLQNQISDWLKSLKDRVQPNCAEWSEDN